MTSYLFKPEYIYGSLTLAHKISTFLNFLANLILLTNSGIGSFPVSPALPKNRNNDFCFFIYIF